MGVPDVEQTKRRLQEILRRARQFEIPMTEVIATRTAQKLLAKTKNFVAWTILIAAFVLLLGGLVYIHWPTQDVETVRTILRRACGSSTTQDFSERVAALLHTSSTQDDC